MTKIAMILGADEATVSDDMQEVLDFEIQLANVSLFPKNTIRNRNLPKKIVCGKIKIFLCKIFFLPFLTKFRPRCRRLNAMTQVPCITS